MIIFFTIKLSSVAVTGLKARCALKSFEIRARGADACVAAFFLLYGECPIGPATGSIAAAIVTTAEMYPSGPCYAVYRTR